MVSVFGNNIISAFTGGSSVREIYTNGELVWANGGPLERYYIYWSPERVTGSFYVSGNRYSTQLYPGRFRVDSIASGIVFSGNNITTFSTDAVIESIPAYAFYNCSYLSWASFPDCTYIGSSAFWYCKSLTSIYLPKCQYIDDYGLSGYRGSSISLPECLSISEFGMCGAYIESLYLPKCQYIGSYAFQQASLKSVSLPSCSYIGNYAFDNCSSLSSIYAPLCEYVGMYAFSDCSSLTSIGSNDLMMCGLIASYAFDWCEGLTYVDFPNCSRINDYAFNYCTNLQTVKLSLCSRIGDAFRNISNLKSVYLYYNGVCSFGTGCFHDVGSTNLTIYVPGSKLTSYRNQYSNKWYSSRFRSI